MVRFECADATALETEIDRLRAERFALESSAPCRSEEIQGRLDRAQLLWLRERELSAALALQTAI